MKKWYNVELNTNEAHKLRLFLIDNSINYETSGAYNLIRFEIELNCEKYQLVNNFLKEM